MTDSFIYNLRGFGSVCARGYTYKLYEYVCVRGAHTCCLSRGQRSILYLFFFIVLHLILPDKIFIEPGAYRLGRLVNQQTLGSLCILHLTVLGLQACSTMPGFLCGWLDCLIVCLFWNKVSLYSPGCPGTHRDLPASAS